MRHSPLLPSLQIQLLTHFFLCLFQAERQAYEQQHMLLTQKIRQTVLTRSGREQQPQLKEAEESSDEVIDLTDKKQPPKTVSANSVITSTSQRSIPEETAACAAAAAAAVLKSKLRDQEYLQQQRELLYMHSLQVRRGVIDVVPVMWFPNQKTANHSIF